MKRIEQDKPWPGPHSAVVRWGQEIFAGSASENYHRADWFQTDIDPKVAESWPTFYGDPNVPEPLGIPMFRKSRLAGIVAVRKVVMQNIRDSYVGELAPGVVTRSLGGEVWACMLPKGVQFVDGGIDGQDCEMVGSRIARGTLHMMPVLIVPETSKIIIPDPNSGDVRPLGPHEFVPRLEAPFANVPVV